MPADIVSRVYQPDQAMCCERCVFGSGQHAEWCWPCPGCDKRLYLFDQIQVQQSSVRCACGATIQTRRDSLAPQPADSPICPTVQRRHRKRTPKTDVSQ